MDEFYENIDNFPASRKIRDMHTKNLSEPRKKLTYFLSGWLGGPKLYAEHYGSINIPQTHKHTNIYQLVKMKVKHGFYVCRKR
ncbi:hypothetical protein [Paraglaciecola sp.]|uniref:globin domain-containing protein n=1 Tax=Paraglaciecola sp. TaxID=1920173 RepID=UPI003266F3A0